MAIARLTIELIAQHAEMQKGMDRGVAIATGAVGRIESKLNGLASVAKGVGAAIGGALAVGGLTQLFRSTVDGIDKLNDLADATGSSIEKLSALEDTAARTGTSLETVGSSLVKLNKTIADAKPGSDAENALKAIGTSAKELRDLDPADALLRVAQGLAQFKDDGNKARLTQELFGKSLREVAPLLKDLNEKGQLNATVTTEQAAAAEKFRQNSAALAKNLTDLARAMVSDLVPALNEISKAFSEGGLKAGFDKLGNLAFDWTNSQGRKEIKRLTADLEELEKKASVVDASFLDKIKKLGSAGAVGLTASGATAQTLAAEMDAAKARIEALTQQLLDSMRPPARTGVGGPAGDKPTAPVVGDAAAAAEIKKRFEEFVQRLREAQLATQDLSEVERTRMALTRPELQGLTDDQRKYLLVLAAINDEMRGRVEVFEDARDAQVRLAKAATLPRPNGEALDRAFRTVRSPDEAGSRAVITNVEALSAQSRAAQIRELSAAMVSVREQMAAGGGSATAYREALDILGERMRALEDNAQDLNEKLGQGSEEAKAAAGQLQEAFGASLLSAMEVNARKIDRIWGDLVRRLVAQAASAKLMEQLFGKNFSSRGELGGWIGRLVGAFGGGGGSAGGGGVTNGFGEVIKNGAGTGSKLSVSTSSKSQASAQGGVVQNVYVQGDVGTKARRAMLGVAAQIQARNQRAAAF